MAILDNKYDIKLKNNELTMMEIEELMHTVNGVISEYQIILRVKKLKYSNILCKSDL